MVLNKADHLAAGDLDRTVAFTERVVRQERAAAVTESARRSAAQGLGSLQLELERRGASLPRSR